MPLKKRYIVGVPFIILLAAGLAVGSSIKSGVINLATSNILGVLGIVNGGTGVSSVTTAPTATAFAGWDSNSNLSANSLIAGYATTVTAAGTTTLTVGSAYQQYFTGTTTQTLKMPAVSTLALGQQWQVVNNSSQSVTVESSGTNTIVVMSPSTWALFTVISTSGTTATSWSYESGSQNSGSGSGYFTSSNSGTGTNAGSTGQYTDLGTIPLTPGVYIFYGQLLIEANGAIALTTAGNILEFGTSTTGTDFSGSSPTCDQSQSSESLLAANTSGEQMISFGPCRHVVTSNTTWHYGAAIAYTGGPPKFFATFTAIQGG
jgi:hypothetical protein